MAPPLGGQDSIFSIELYAKLRHGPSFVSWAVALSTQRVGQITGLNLSEDLFFFGFHLILGKKSD